MRLWPRAKDQPATRADTTPLRALAGSARLPGGRESIDNNLLIFGGTNLILPPADAESTWRLGTLDTRTLDRISPVKLMEALADLSPDVSRAVWDWLRLLNSGWDCQVTQPGSDQPSKPGQAAVDGFLSALGTKYGSVDVVINRLNIGAFLRGAFMAELVLDAAGRMPLDLATPDPASARFRRIVDPVLGIGWQLGQWQRTFVVLDRPTVRYVPVDPFPGSPYGRSPVAPALFPTLFLLGLLHDLRRVVAQQGYPRLDLTVGVERLIATMPATIRESPDDLKAWVNATIAEVQKVYDGLEPDDAYIHTDVVTVNRPVGTVNADSLGAIDGLIQALERMTTRALKTTPFMMGSNQSTTETQSNREFEALLQAVKALQHLCEQLLEYLLGLSLQAQGIAASVTFRFAENRAAEMQRDALTESTRIDNAIKKYLYGWASQEEVAAEIVGHAPALPEPLAIPTVDSLIGGVPDAAVPTPEPGANRTRARVTKFVPLGADQPLLPVPAVVAYDDADVERIVKMWDDNVPATYRGMLDAAIEEAG